MIGQHRMLDLMKSLVEATHKILHVHGQPHLSSALMMPCVIHMMSTLSIGILFVVNNIRNWKNDHNVRSGDEPLTENVFEVL